MYRARMPIQLLAYLRLARLTDPALLAKAHNHPHPPSSARCHPCISTCHVLLAGAGKVRQRMQEVPGHLQLAEVSAADDVIGCHAGDL